MSDKDQFTFEDGDDLLETSFDEKVEPQKPSFDDEDSQERTLADQESLESELDNENPMQADLDDLNESQELDLSYDDDFPETDLSEAFSEDEYVAGDSVLNEPEKVVKEGSNPRTRILLMVLLLVIAVGAGAYYFMGLGGTTPSVPTVPVAVKKTTKSVALPASSVKKAPVVPAKVQPAAKPVTVAVPPPPPPVAKPVTVAVPSPPVAKPVTVAVPPPPVAKPVAKAAPTKQSVTATTKQTAPVAKPVGKVVVEKTKNKAEEPSSVQVAVPVPQPKVVETKAVPAPAAQKVVVSSPVPTPVASIKASEPAKQVAGGVFALDAGSYLFESSRESLVEKIKKLGYEPLITPVDATLDMTRLRLGTFGKDEVKEALDFARSIEPGAYSAPAGDGYVVYAGTFLKSRNIEKLSQRFLEEGIKTHAEPVQVVRTLSRIRFGSFATKEDATAAVQEVAEVGIKAVVITSK